MEKILKEYEERAIRAEQMVDELVKRLEELETRLKQRKKNSEEQSIEKKNVKSEVRERTFIMIKPDGVQRGLVGDVIRRFESRGYKLIAMKFTLANQNLAEQHYADLSSKPFFKSLVQVMLLVKRMN